jgi:hypothetical protein
MTRQFSHEEWLAEGRALFGDDYFEWAFKCPACGHVAKMRDFRQFKDRGATPESAAQECIGRYTLDQSLPGDKYQKMLRRNMKNGGPCDWAAYGLFDICETRVLMPGKDKAIPVFSFAKD